MAILTLESCYLILILCVNVHSVNDIIFGLCVFVQLDIKLKPAVFVIIARNVMKMS